MALIVTFAMCAVVASEVGGFESSGTLLVEKWRFSVLLYPFSVT